MGFKFRYEALLSYREHLKEKAETDLSLAQRQLRKDRELLEEHKRNMIQTNASFLESLKKKASSGFIKNYSDYIFTLEKGIEAQTEKINESEKIVKEKLDILLLKTKQYKVFEQLKERDFQLWSQQQNLLEQKEISETTLLRYGKEFL